MKIRSLLYLVITVVWFIFFSFSVNIIVEVYTNYTIDSVRFVTLSSLLAYWITIAGILIRERYISNGVYNG